MSKRMLIDATHSEETRVAVVDGNRLEDYDYESKVRKQLKGSIFLAKVTRVEPSLQAAFVNFGGNRHGFLPFSEIHVDYFRIPVDEQKAFLEEQKAEMEARRKAEEEADEARGDDEDENGDDDEDEEDVEELGGEDVIEDPETEKSGKKKGGNKGGRGKPKGRPRRNAAARGKKVEMVGGDNVEGDQPFRPSLHHKYKIQEVIKRGQVMLIQVSKEERGNKGAAVSTYLSLPGRYCVLMPNSPRGGGVSRKIASYKERKRMREILSELKVPEGMSVIMRTAGVSRTKTEIKRDLDYLLRLWNSIRETTLESNAPALIHEEGQLIRRSIRDIYTRDIEEVLVAGDDGYKKAKDFMKMMIPSHAKRVKEYKDDQIPLFHRYQVESQIGDMGDPTVTLPSGGYLVINPTEALVSIDVNSGRATKERHIEETALKTNMEAAEEVARQLRLRDLAGLVVIDFIDMEQRRNNRKVENKLKNALSNDRARLQVGRISSFGLLELSRQRLNPSLTEAQFERCKHCSGSGVVRTIDAAAITALRALEEEGIRGRVSEVILQISNNVALYILNNKRAMLTAIEERYGFKVMIEVNEELAPAGYVLEPVKGSGAPEQPEQDEDKQDEEQKQEDEKDSKSSSRGRRGGRRRGRRGGRRRGGDNRDRNDEQDSGNEDETPKEEKSAERAGDKEEKPEKKSGRNAAQKTSKASSAKTEKQEDDDGGDEKSAAKKSSSAKKKAPAKKSSAKADDKENDKKKSEDDSKKKSAAKSNKKDTSKPSNDVEPQKKDYEVVNEAPKNKKKGWWNRLTN